MKANCPVPALRGGQSSAFDPRASGLAILIAPPAQQRDHGPRRHENVGNVGLRLSAVDNSAVHIGPSSKGKFDLSNEVLTVYWEGYKPDVFIRVSDVFVHETLLRNIPQI